jgi:hypothetical protein
LEFQSKPIPVLALPPSYEPTEKVVVGQLCIVDGVSPSQSHSDFGPALIQLLRSIGTDRLVHRQALVTGQGLSEAEQALVHQ